MAHHQYLEQPLYQDPMGQYIFTGNVIWNIIIFIKKLIITVIIIIICSVSATLVCGEESWLLAACFMKEKLKSKLIILLFNLPGYVWSYLIWQNPFNSFHPGQNRWLFTDENFRCIFLNENICIFIKFPLKFVPMGPIGNNSTLVEIMDTDPIHWRIYVALGGDEWTHWGRDKMDAISQTIFSSAFSWMKMFEFRLKFQWSLFLRVQLTIFQHWFR